MSFAGKDGSTTNSHDRIEIPPMSEEFVKAFWGTYKNGTFLFRLAWQSFCLAFVLAASYGIMYYGWQIIQFIGSFL